MAENDPTTPYVPPGNRALISVVTEFGADRVRGWLAGSGWLAIHMDVFALDPKTGREYILEDVALWNSERAVEVLRTGKLGDLVLFVRNFDWPPDHVFNPPDEREGFPPQSPEPIEPAVAPEKAEDKPATPVEPEPEPAELPEPGEPEEPATPDLQILEAEPPARHPGGKEPDHDWEGAACYVDGKVDDKIEGRKPLPRNAQGAPIVQRAIDLMKDYFKDHDPPPPENRSMRRWIAEHPVRTQWWWDAE